MIGLAAAAAPAPDWSALLARVEAGELPRDVAHDAGVSVQALGSRLGNARRWGVTSVEDWWTPARDLALAEALTAGRGTGGAAKVLRCPADACLRRWRVLMPEPGTEAQAKLLRRLRAEVAEG